MEYDKVIIVQTDVCEVHVVDIRSSDGEFSDFIDNHRHNKSVANDTLSQRRSCIASYSVATEKSCEAAVHSLTPIDRHIGCPTN